MAPSCWDSRNLQPKIISSVDHVANIFSCHTGMPRLTPYVCGFSFELPTCIMCCYVVHTIVIVSKRRHFFIFVVNTYICMKKLFSGTLPLITTLSCKLGCKVYNTLQQQYFCAEGRFRMMSECLRPKAVSNKFSVKWAG